MKKLIATLGFLLVATASLGEAGQHTGVGGNPAPAVPPPQPSGFTTPPMTFQALIVQPGVLIFIPNQLDDAQDADQQPQQDAEQPDDAGE